MNTLTLAPLGPCPSMAPLPIGSNLPCPERVFPCLPSPVSAGPLCVLCPHIVTSSFLQPPSAVCPVTSSLPLLGCCCPSSRVSPPRVPVCPLLWLSPPTGQRVPSASCSGLGVLSPSEVLHQSPQSKINEEKPNSQVHGLVKGKKKKSNKKEKRNEEKSSFTAPFQVSFSLFLPPVKASPSLGTPTPGASEVLGPASGGSLSFLVDLHAPALLWARLPLPGPGPPPPPPPR